MAVNKLLRMRQINFIVLGALLAVFWLSGCASQKKETAQPLEQKAGSVETVAGAERQLTGIFVSENDRTINVQLAATKSLTYTSIKQDFPFGIALYLPETRISDTIQNQAGGTESISDVVVSYADQDQMTTKVEILLKEDLSYEVVEKDSALIVSLLKNSATDTNHMATETEVIRNDEPVSNVVVPDKTAKMEHIEFNTMEDGNSDILIRTDHPIKYDIAQKGYDTIYLNLYNTLIPDYHKRPLLTQYFKSAVESLMPIQVPGKEKDSKIEIKIRQAVPYRVVQRNNLLALHFEPSTIEPPVFSKARKKVSSDTVVELSGPGMQQPQPMQTNSSQGADIVAQKAEEQEDTKDSFLSPKVYTGEKIKLDFYDTDIKNVFRILRSIAGLNFAIDKDVTGKVTLALEEPVPWDQVMDLILKMNDLGQKKEGSVIRIAKLEKLQKEEQLLQAAIAARKKTIEESKALEPLLTEYIPINYSDATNDIKPHIEKIITPERGKISVNTRTNMIIMTDTQEKINQAKELIYRLDKVTPQIMIEAKVVEVTKDFSRELGIGFSFNRTQTAWTGNAEDFSIALNNPVGAAGNNNMSFNFYRLFGSDFLNLNAQLAASESKGDVKVVSSPRILTLDNKKAKIKQGLEYAYLERDSSGGSSVKFKNIDLLLEVTPHVTPDNRISMTVFLTKNDLDTVTSGVPSLSTNEAETELLVNNNDTVVIGGIVKTTETDGYSGTPYLQGIPILGRLFRTDVDKDKRNELLIFLTPSIVQLEQKKN